MLQQRGRGNIKPAIAIAFEGDVGSRIDAILAIAMLNGFATKGEARRITLGIPRASLKAAQFDAHGRPPLLSDVVLRGSS